MVVMRERTTALESEQQRLLLLQLTYQRVSRMTSLLESLAQPLNQYALDRLSCVRRHQRTTILSWSQASFFFTNFTKTKPARGVFRQTIGISTCLALDEIQTSNYFTPQLYLGSVDFSHKCESSIPQSPVEMGVSSLGPRIIFYHDKLMGDSVAHRIPCIGRSNSTLDIPHQEAKVTHNRPLKVSRF